MVMFRSTWPGAVWAIPTARRFFQLPSRAVQRMQTQAGLRAVFGHRLPSALRSLAMIRRRQFVMLRIHLDLRPRQLAATDAASTDQLLTGTARIAKYLRSAGNQ
jgi:hypothetical protein